MAALGLGFGDVLLTDLFDVLFACPARLHARRESSALHGGVFGRIQIVCRRVYGNM